jgi:hypothetical protein
MGILVLILLAILAVVVFGALAAFVGKVFLIGLAVGAVAVLLLGGMRLRPGRN